MTITIKESIPDDIAILEKTEKICFPAFQQSTRRTLRLSLNSSFQEVWIAEQRKGKQKEAIGILVLHLHARSIRVFSIAVLPDFRDKGIDRKLLQHACNLGLAKGCEKITPEASEKNTKLTEWYKAFGFVKTDSLSNYYAEGEHAVKMVFTLSRPKSRALISNLIVVDKPSG
jgi:ribosomal protein S18 acetylase RimI-like enzyme